MLDAVCPPGTFMPRTGANANTCQPCETGSYCPGGSKKANLATDDMGTPKTCNNLGSVGLTTKQPRSTKPTDCGELLRLFGLMAC